MQTVINAEKGRIYQNQLVTDIANVLKINTKATDYYVFPPNKSLKRSRCELTSYKEGH